MAVEIVEIISGVTPSSAEALLPALHQIFDINVVAERINDTSFRIIAENTLNDFRWHTEAWLRHVASWSHGFIAGYQKGCK